MVLWPLKVFKLDLLTCQRTQTSRGQRNTMQHITSASNLNAWDIKYLITDPRATFSMFFLFLFPFLIYEELFRAPELYKPDRLACSSIQQIIQRRKSRIVRYMAAFKQPNRRARVNLSSTHNTEELIKTKRHNLSPYTYGVPVPPNFSYLLPSQSPSRSSSRPQGQSAPAGRPQP